ncbi:MAG: prolipoprotein diacylglyceryl transferase [Elusimicrobia bacterium]|nr:prolipoprotein diacylglyceryl transferase [Elusimicrobiota bacterium]
MYPRLFSISGLTIHTYGVFVAIGALLGLHLAIRAARFRSVPANFINQLFAGTLLSGFAGARMGYVVISLKWYLDNPSKIIAVWDGGLVYWGGFIGGALWIVYACRKAGYDILSVADVLSPGLALAHACGRIGCFFAGCCYGKPSAFGVIFTDPACLAEPLGVRLHPTQLYSALFLFVLAGVLYGRIKKKASPVSSVFGLYLVSYGVFRVFVEFLRADFRGPLFLGLTPTQLISLAGIAAGAAFLVKRKRSV